ncbi:hypothetical protein DM860_006947 [Cuscuta australis]|uniref:Glycosyltransferase n=1 Tax=Cuscuta australis TaxID=267555 RepID=A0A328E5I9_9ASTE|nr:hypothetical protein DM860_006947 [Cuscuta australis]
MEMQMKQPSMFIFLCSPAIGHLVPTMEFAKLLLHKQNLLSITFLAMNPPFDDPKLASYFRSLVINSASIRLNVKTLSPNLAEMNSNPSNFLGLFIDSHGAQVRDHVKTMMGSRDFKVLGFIADVLCAGMTADVAEEFNLPYYVFYTSGAAVLGLQLHLLSLAEENGGDATEHGGCGVDSDYLNVPTYVRPFPAKLLPSIMLDRNGGCDLILDLFRKIRNKAKGIIVNTFLELEPHAVKSLCGDHYSNSPPPVYTVGPVLNLRDLSAEEANSPNLGEEEDYIFPQSQNKEFYFEKEEVYEWLDSQPESSVVFLCFGSVGFFPEEQLNEIAHALEDSKQRFVWAMRPPHEVSWLELFLRRTEGGQGKVVVSWAPQAAILGHPAVGGFVSHCGWNSILESIWFGKPIAAWPIYGEQQANAFHVVGEIGVGVGIKMDYKMEYPNKVSNTLVRAKEIEMGIESLMDPTNPIRLKAGEMKERSRLALMKGGSSHTSLERFFHQVCNNVE